MEACDLSIHVFLMLFSSNSRKRIFKNYNASLKCISGIHSVLSNAHKDLFILFFSSEQYD